MRNAVALLFACLALVTPSAVPAETLEDVVRDLEAAYSRMTDLRAEFTQTAFNKSLNQTIPAQGTVYLKRDRKSTRLNSSHLVISYAVFCLKKKKKKYKKNSQQEQIKKQARASHSEKR